MRRRLVLLMLAAVGGGATLGGCLDEPQVPFVYEARLQTGPQRIALAGRVLPEDADGAEQIRITYQGYEDALQDTLRVQVVNGNAATDSLTLSPALACWTVCGADEVACADRGFVPLVAQFEALDTVASARGCLRCTGPDGDVTTTCP